MITSKINQTIELLPLVGHDLKQTGAYHVGACPFCGGRDRFTVKHTPQGDRWFCRQCGDGKYHTVIDYIMQRDNCDFKTAYQSLTGEEKKHTRMTAASKPKPNPQPINLPPIDWQIKALRITEEASDCLLSDKGQAGQEYLAQRGLLSGTWYAWLLGFANWFDPKVKRNRPAILLPWLDLDARKELITNIKIRFIDKCPEGLRYTSLKGGKPLLFGLWDVVDLDTTLLLVEGEFNALSIWQCRPRGVSVLSFGSERGGRAEVLSAIAKRYEQVFVWCDDAARTKEYQSMLARPCIKIKSPIIEGDKLDANRLLQLGKLHDLLSQLMGIECVGKQAGES